VIKKHIVEGNAWHSKVTQLMTGNKNKKKEKTKVSQGPLKAHAQ
jgi:hypothetical protein